MSDDTFELAANFPRTTYAEWLEAAEKALKRSDVEKALSTRTYEGFALKPLRARRPTSRTAASASEASIPATTLIAKGAI